MQEIRRLTDREELDYGFVMHCLQRYASPRAKLTRMLKAGELIRVKKGIYITGAQQRRSLYSPEILANMIYGPSYVSLEYALAYYGLIPEHVEEVTSVTSKRKANFQTPIGRFSYYKLPQRLYAVGFTCREMVEGRSALIASPEKALCDLLYVHNARVQAADDLPDLLFDHYRLEAGLLARFRIRVLKAIRNSGGIETIDHLIAWIREQ